MHTYPAAHEHGSPSLPAPALLHVVAPLPTTMHASPGSHAPGSSSLQSSTGMHTGTNTACSASNRRRSVHHVPAPHCDGIAQQCALHCPAPTSLAPCPPRTHASPAAHALDPVHGAPSTSTPATPHTATPSPALGDTLHTSPPAEPASPPAHDASANPGSGSHTVTSPQFALRVLASIAASGLTCAASAPVSEAPASRCTQPSTHTPFCPSPLPIVGTLHAPPTASAAASAPPAAKAAHPRARRRTLTSARCHAPLDCPRCRTPAPPPGAAPA